MTLLDLVVDAGRKMFVRISLGVDVEVQDTGKLSVGTVGTIASSALLA
jgi:hypothetical protein